MVPPMIPIIPMIPMTPPQSQFEKVKQAMFNSFSDPLRSLLIVLFVKRDGTKNNLPNKTKARNLFLASGNPISKPSPVNIPINEHGNHIWFILHSDYIAPLE